MRKALLLLWVVALSACAGGGMPTTSPLPSTESGVDRTGQTQAQRQAPAQAQTQTMTIASKTWIIGTGASYNYYSDQLLDFLPTAMTINAGDKIEFQVASGAGGDAHTIAFVPLGSKPPPPSDPNNAKPTNSTNTFATVDGTKFVNSGIEFGGQRYTMQFLKAGTYKIYCLFHEPAMMMTVTVNPAGTAYPHTQAYYTNLGATDEWQDFSEARQSVSTFPFPNYGTTFAAGIAPGLGTAFPPPDSTILRFLNSGSWPDVAGTATKTIRVGTVLTFVNETTNEPHTVTILPAGQSELPAALAPDPAINAVPYPGVTTFDGTKLVNSGTLVRAPGAPYAFAVKFTKAGKFYFACIYHDNSGMDGVVTVNP